MAAKPRSARPLWTCPRCGRRFVTANMWHSCGRFRLADHFAGTTPPVRKSFARLRALARQCGPVTVYPQKSRITIMARVRFANAITHKAWLEVTVWLKRRPIPAHERINRVEDFKRLGYVLHFRIEEPAQLDAPFVALLEEAYQVGIQAEQRPGA